MDTDAAILNAVRNNSRWCDAICRAHDVPGEFHAAYWINRGALPPYIPQLITLAGAAHAPEQLAAIRSLLRAEPEQCIISVKDAFQTLPLGGLGFRVLFHATWICRPPGTEPPLHPAEQLQWSVVRDARQLTDWESAWRGDPTNAHAADATIFVPSLLDEPELHFLAGRCGGAVVASAALNGTGDVVGLSNVSSGASGVGPLFPGCVRLAHQLYPGRAVVGYERGAELAAAEQAGFRRLRDLTVWQRAER